MPPKIPRGARYWLKENYLDWQYPKISWKEYERRAKIWPVGEVITALTCVPVGLYCTLRYFKPDYCTWDFPLIIFFQYEFNYECLKAIRPRLEPKE